MAETVLGKKKAGYGYKYTELAQINEYIESIGETYYQEVETDENGNDYIVTIRINQAGVERRIRGFRITSAVLSGAGEKNPVQCYGAGITYIRRYSLLAAYGLATEDEDAKVFTPKQTDKDESNNPKKDTVNVEAAKPAPMTKDHQAMINELLEQSGLDAEVVFGMPVAKMCDKDFQRACARIHDKSGK